MDVDALIVLFSQLFQESEKTLLLRSEGEPIYLPNNDEEGCHHILFAHGFFASALHELSHWCIAGKKRRALTDYGYWYEPDGRTLDQQLAFAKVEAKPQALEWIFNQACGRRFCISLDNLDGKPGDDLPFKLAVIDEIIIFKRQGLGKRAVILQQALAKAHHQSEHWQDYPFTLSELGR